MDDSSLLRSLEPVAAPADFEDRVAASLARRRAALAAERRTRPLRYSLAGAAAVLFAGFLGLNVLGPRKGGDTAIAPAVAERRSPLPITESMSYRNEVLAASAEPRTVYILEQVSDNSYKYVKY